VNFKTITLDSVHGLENQVNKALPRGARVVHVVVTACYEDRPDRRISQAMVEEPLSGFRSVGDEPDFDDLVLR
jgi:hypothetical protein